MPTEWASAIATGVRITTTGVLFMNAETVAAPAVRVNIPIRGEPEAYRESRRPGLLDHTGPLECRAQHEHGGYRDRRLVAENRKHLLGRQHAGDEEQGDAAHRDDIDAEALRHHGREHRDQQHEHEVWLDEIPGHAVIPIRLRA